MKKGFTLIELLAVIVILAIIALIAIPVVVNIINDSKDESEKRSIELYAKSFENYIAKNGANDLLYNYANNGKLEKTYSGSRIKCEFSNSSNSNDDYSTLVNGKLILRGCKIEGSSNYYKYENGNASLQQIYKTYNIGKTIFIKNEKYYVIEYSGKYKDYVVAFKDMALTYDEVNLYGTSYLEKISSYDSELIRDWNGYGCVEYYSSENCRNGNNANCINDYNESDIKHIVDNWASDKFSENELVLLPFENYGEYKARLISVEDFLNVGGSIIQKTYFNGLTRYTSSLSCFRKIPYYWTMSKYRGENEDIIHSSVFYVDSYGYADESRTYEAKYAINPVINVSKSIVEEN